ncbi:uncharacterized protein [Musca autumnalis]|uniref:uncharacterized protein n=1 Tax=Musca autumnalis TaxID=221902 RepID=UPI003CFB3A19
MARHICNYCAITFNVKRQFLKHVKMHCKDCGQLFSNVSQLKFHQLSTHTNQQHESPTTSQMQANKIDKINRSDKLCKECNVTVKNMISHIRCDNHRRVVRKNMGKNIKIIKSAFNQNITSYEVENTKDIILPRDFLKDAKDSIIKCLKFELGEKTNIKINMELQGQYNKPTAVKENPSKSTESTTTEQVFNHISKSVVVSLGDDLEEIFTNHENELVDKSDEFQERGSGWALEKLLKIDVNIKKVNLTRGSQFIPTPPSLRSKGACINIKNKDENCFKWCMVAALSFPRETHVDRTFSYKVDIKQDIIRLETGITLNFLGLCFPLGLKDVKLFEKANPEISVNVFGYENESIVGPYHLTKEEKTHHVNLILLNDGDKFHYIWIKNISRLLRSQLTKHKEAAYICNGCIQPFHVKENLDVHKKQCGGAVFSMPQTKKDAIVKFVNHKKKEKVGFSIYADAESVLKHKEQEPNSNRKTVQVKEHIPCAFSYNIKCSFDSSLDKFFIYTGPDAPKVFLENLIEDCKFLYNNYLTKVQPMITLTPEEESQFKTSINCHICDEPLEGDRVRDHCHLTGKYRGAVHNQCNLKYQVPKFIPIFFHNFSGYDCHLFFKELADFGGEIKVIPQNKELYISMSYFINMKKDEPTDTTNSNSTVVVDEEEETIDEEDSEEGGEETSDEEVSEEEGGEDNEKDKKKKNRLNRLELRFLDSFRYMSTSLDKLAKNLPKDAFHAVKPHFPNEEDFALLTRKGVFPYEYLSSFEKLDETQLPPIEEFHNKMTDSECSIEDYNHATKVWTHFRCKTLKDYMELYLKTDVLLLTDIFENFRDLCRGIHSLDPCQYFTAPSLSWDAMLLCTKVELELFTDINMYNFCKNAIRGGLTQCSNRHSVANNEDAPNYDKKKPEVNIYYLDVNNLYGTAMTKPLPEKDFKWEENLEKFNDPKVIEAIPEDSKTGYILEVDLEYPEHLHDQHNDLPFCPENKCVGGSKTKKLIADLTDKMSYTIHYSALQQCLKHGLVLKKVHRVLSFKQRAWLAPYIVKNNMHRENAKNAFEKDFFKLLNNSVYGKTMENIDKRKTVKIVTEWEDKNNQRKINVASKLIAKPNFHSLSIFSENMVAIQMRNVKVKYDKPLYLGFCVLEISKVLMYDFLYNFLKAKFGDAFILNYMDTDSFIITFIGLNLYMKLTRKEIDERFDTSDFSPNNKYGIPLINKKKLGMMKDENNGKTMLEFVGLRPKVYAIKVVDSDDVKKSKGVKKSVIKKYTIDTYRECLYDKKILYDTMYSFRSRQHTITTDKITKISLSHQDDKRFIREDGISTYAWGHNKLNNINEDLNLGNLHSPVPMDID